MGCRCPCSPPRCRRRCFPRVRRHQQAADKLPLLQHIRQAAEKLPLQQHIRRPTFTGTALQGSCSSKPHPHSPYQMYMNRKHTTAACASTCSTQPPPSLTHGTHVVHWEPCAARPRARAAQPRARHATSTARPCPPVHRTRSKIAYLRPSLHRLGGAKARRSRRQMYTAQLRDKHTPQADNRTSTKLVSPSTCRGNVGFTPCAAAPHQARGAVLVAPVRLGEAAQSVSLLTLGRASKKEAEQLGVTDAATGRGKTTVGRRARVEPDKGDGKVDILTFALAVGQLPAQRLHTSLQTVRGSRVLASSRAPPCSCPCRRAHGRSCG
jgi:hypothetical protein